MPEFRDACFANGTKLDDVPKDLELMLKLALPLNRNQDPYFPEEMPSWLAPSFLMSSSPISKANVNELFKKLPKPIADFLTSMPAGEQGEDIRVKFMHSAVYYRDFAERYHIGKAALQAEAVKKQRPRTQTR